jgi:hypothetical protein
VSTENSYVVLIFQVANILVDNKGCIKLADFGALKQVEKLVSGYVKFFVVNKNILTW